MTEYKKMIDEQLENMTDEEVEQMRADFLKSEFDPEDEQELAAFADIGLKVLQEDNSLNLFELYQSEELRAKTWEMVALTTCHLAKLFPEEKRVSDFKAVLEKHFQNMVRKEVRKANPVAVSRLLRKARNEASEPLTREQLERISIASSLALVALEELEHENMES